MEVLDPLSSVTGIGFPADPTVLYCTVEGSVRLRWAPIPAAGSYSLTAVSVDDNTPR